MDNGIREKPLSQPFKRQTNSPSSRGAELVVLTVYMAKTLEMDMQYEINYFTFTVFADDHSPLKYFPLQRYWPRTLTEYFFPDLSFLKTLLSEVLLL